MKTRFAHAWYNTRMQAFRRTRIVATIGPASGSISMLTRMITAGVDIVRLNFSHGKHEEHKDYIAHVRAAAKRLNKQVAILQDLQGPKIRVGEIDPMDLTHGEHIALVEGNKGEAGEIPITYSFIRSVKKGERILLDDGFIELMVTGKRGKKVQATVVQGGPLISRKGAHFPDSRLTDSAFTEKDHEDMLFGIEHGVDYIALSFVESPKEVAHIRDIILRAASRKRVMPPRIIAKIERKEAIENFLEILPHVDGIMVARGDLGLDIPLEEVPIVQKELIEMCRIAGKPVIVATHMLESMIKHIRPTRAEVSDVANAVIDHTDAVMLSAETATGEHPYATVQIMDRVIRETELSYLDDVRPDKYTEDAHVVIAQSVHKMAQSGIISGIAVRAEHAALVRKVGMYRPEIPIYLFCKDEENARRNLLHAGITPIISNLGTASFELAGHGELVKKKYIRAKEKVAFVHEGANGTLQFSIK